MGADKRTVWRIQGAEGNGAIGESGQEVLVGGAGEASEDQHEDGHVSVGGGQLRNEEKGERHDQAGKGHPLRDIPEI